jgi:hypothetical protein
VDASDGRRIEAAKELERGRLAGPFRELVDGFGL